MIASILLLPLILTAAPVDDGLIRSGANDRDLGKMSKDVNAFFAALEDDDRSQQQDSLKSLKAALGKALKKAKATEPLISYLGDWDVIMELAKPIDRTFKSKAGKGFFKHVFEEPYEKSRLAVLLSLPSGYGKDDGFLPVIVALKPPMGLVGSELEDAVSEQATALYGDVLESQIVMVLLGPESGDERKAETTEVTDSWTSNDGAYVFYTSYRILLEQLRFDRSRVVLDGWEGAGGDALGVVTGAPSFFAGVVARGGEYDLPDLILSNLDQLSLLYVAAPGEEGGDEEPNLLQRGVDGVDIAYVQESASLAEPSDETRAAISDWLGKVRKNLVPLKISYSLGDLRNQSINWCKASLINKRGDATPSDPDFPRLSASIDQAKNEISIESVNVTEMEIYLSDALVDMSRELTITVNGEELWSKVNKPSLQMLLENRYYSDSGDYGLYTAKVRLDNIDPNLPESESDD
ncbi:MAG: hypothetical protein ACI9EF_001928 [Pseudohongiellaceae bacterium]|jgi:hypothetical protein